MDLLAIADFALVVTHGGFGAASRTTGRPKATLSRRVLALEKSLGVRLIERGSRPLRTTEAGALLHARTSALLTELAEATATARAASGSPRGPLRVSAPQLLADMTLGRIAAGFVRAHPAVRLDITADDRIADLATDRYDLVIRVDPAPDETLVGRRILRDERWLVAPVPAAPPAARPDGAPPEVGVVVRSVPRAGAVWRLRRDGRRVAVRPVPVARLSSLPMLRDAVLAGAGAALLPRSLIGHDVAARRLACWGVEDSPATELWALHTSRRLVNPAVTAFIDHLARALAEGGEPVLFRPAHGDAAQPTRTESSTSSPTGVET